MASLYEINLQREILREKSSEILGYFNNYMECHYMEISELYIEWR